MLNWGSTPKVCTIGIVVSAWGWWQKPAWPDADVC